ncbi:hypothetical protein VTN49DRAFT_7440 [Thermomyces lanuginosus]|uniref:mitochondrial 54S ribosomal protein uL10m n=1 Tax=Thermomyces lanuginosus TaxID=5541 RepID=UPI0037435840
MAPRIRIPSHLSRPLRCGALVPRYEAAIRTASTAAAATTSPAQSIDPITAASYSQLASHHPTQPPSFRSPEARRSQLLRQYTSIVRTSPLMVFLQHNNLLSTEWVAIRRELVTALRKLDERLISEGRTGVPPLADLVKLQIVQTRIFDAALRIVDYFDPKAAGVADGEPTHDLSRAAHDVVFRKKGKHDLSPILAGPIAVLTFPVVSPEHLKAALSVLAPKEMGFPAPTRKANPGWHEPSVQDGLRKLMVLATRVDGRVFDTEETKWVGSIEGGLDGLRAQLVYALQSVGAGLTSTLEGAAKSLWLTMESRRSVLEEEQKGGEKKEE